MRQHRHERGSNLVEAAIVTPMLVLLLAGVVDFGRAFHDYIAIINAAREGARAAAKLPCLSYTSYRDAVFQVTKDAAHTRPGAEADVVLSNSNISTNFASCPASGAPVRVTVQYSFDTMLGGLLGADTLTLQSYTEMSRVKQD